MTRRLFVFFIPALLAAQPVATVLAGLGIVIATDAAMIAASQLIL